MWEWLKDPAVKVVEAHPDGLVKVHKACEECVRKDIELARLRDENRQLVLQAQKPATPLLAKPAVKRAKKGK